MEKYSHCWKKGFLDFYKTLYTVFSYLESHYGVAVWVLQIKPAEHRSPGFDSRPGKSRKQILSYLPWYSMCFLGSTPELYKAACLGF